MCVFLMFLLQMFFGFQMVSFQDGKYPNIFFVPHRMSNFLTNGYKIVSRWTTFWWFFLLTDARSYLVWPHSGGVSLPTDAWLYLVGPHSGGVSLPTDAWLYLVWPHSSGVYLPKEVLFVLASLTLFDPCDGYASLYLTWWKVLFIVASLTLVDLFDGDDSFRIYFDADIEDLFPLSDVQSADVLALWFEVDGEDFFLKFFII